MSVLRIGTRRSALALAQASLVARQLTAAGVACALVPMDAEGDADRRPLPGRSQEGIFVGSLRQALLRGEIDAVVHSWKDLPCGEPAGLVVAASPRREDPADVLVTAQDGIGALPRGARVGTCSVRRSAWVSRHRPDVSVLPLRGPIDVRIDEVQAGRLDAIVLAAAGLNRLACPLPGRIRIPVGDLVPAPAQGALALECRSDALGTRQLLGRVDHAPTRLAALAERAVLAAVDPTEATAVGALAIVHGDALHLLADLAAPDGSRRRIIRRTMALSGVAPASRARSVEGLGAVVGEALLGAGTQEQAS